VNSRNSAVLAFLIADIRGYTTFTRTRGDAAAAELAATFAELAREGVEAHGGTVIELRGDEALATFSSPREALRAAVGLQQIFADEVVLKPDVALNVGIGLDAGEAVAVESGYRGDALNFAARLCSNAQATEILASEQIARLAGEFDGVEFEPVDGLSLKGIGTDVRAVRVRGTTAGRPLTGRFDGDVVLPVELDPITPIIGRDTEARRLRWAWRRARRGAGSGLVISGATGIGKTRLAAEGALAAAADHAEVVHGSPFGSRIGQAVERVEISQRPTFVVLDDLESATDQDLDDVIRMAGHIVGRPIMLIAIASDDSRAEVAAALRAVAAHALSPAEGQLRVGPLDDASVAAIVTGYAVDTTEPPPVWAVAQASGGRPAAVHELAAEWAHQAATRRLGNSVTRTADGRSNLRQLESEVASNVMDLQLAQARLNVAGRTHSRDERCPFMGLVSFDVGDADLFFGRERLVAEMVGRLAGSPFLGVVGPSGSGKSSAVRAGLVQALSDGALPGAHAWTRVIMRPGAHPVRELDRLLYAALPADSRSKMSADSDADDPLRAAAEALPPEARPLIVVDQFEELFTTADDAERDHFIGILERAGRGGYATIVAAIRADFYGRGATYPGLATLLADAHVLVGPMTADEYRRAVEGPARRAGLAIDPALVDALIFEVAEEPGALPLLSTALVELWDRREGRAIRLAAYAATGGVRGAVARLAESTFETLDQDQQRIARGLFLRLSSGEGDSVVRRRVPLAEIDAVENQRVAGVVRALTDARLLTIGEGTIEVAHEALLREWPRLVAWIDEDREGRRLREHLASSAREWQSRERDPAELYRGARLTAAIDWTTDHTFELNETERTFIAESRQLATAETIRQRRSNRRLRGLLAVSAVALVVAVAAGVAAFVQGRDAARSALVADAQRIGAQGLTESNLDVALLLARQGVAFDDDTVTRANLLSAIVRSPAAIGAWRPVPGRPLGVNVSPDGKRLISWNNTGNAYLIDAQTGATIGDALDAYYGAFTPDGSAWVASSPKDSGTDIGLVAVGSAIVQHKISIGQGVNWFVAPDLSTYSTVDADRHGVTVTDSGTGAMVRHVMAPANTTVLDVYQYGPQDVVAIDHSGLIDFSDPSLPDPYNAPVQLDFWPAGATQPTASITAPYDGGFTLSPDDTEIAVSETHDTIAIYDLPGGNRHDFTLRHNNLNGVAWSPDGKLLLSAGDDKLIDVWDATTGQQMETLAGHNGRVFAPAIAQVDGRTVAWSVSLDGQLIEWDLSGDRRIDRPFSVAPAEGLEGGLVMDIAVAPDGTEFATTGQNGVVTVTDSRTLATLQTVQLGDVEKAFSLAFSPDSKALVVGGQGSTLLQRFDTSSWTPVGSALVGFSATGAPDPNAPPGAPPPPNTVRSIAYSPDGKLIAAGSEDGTVRFWDAATGAQAGPTIDVGGPVWHVAFDPDGSHIAATYIQDSPFGGEAGVWNVADGQRLYTVSVDDDYGAPWAAVFSHDGKTLATGGGIGYVRFWDAKTGQETGNPILAEAGWVDSLDYTADDSELLAAGTDGQVKALDPVGRSQLGSALPIGDFDSIATIGPDGRVFAVTQDTGHGYVWDVSLPSLETFACSVPGRTLTAAEWARYLPNRPYDPACRDSVSSSSSSSPEPSSGN
jgi:WD40 repeat protein/class 3 adenylate cyclase